MAESLTSREKSSVSHADTLCKRYVRRWMNGTPGAASLVYTNSYPARRYQWTTQGWNIPRFHARRKRGELLPQTPFNQYKEEGDCTGHYDMNYLVSQGVYDQWWAGEGNFIPFTDWIVSYSEAEALLPSMDKKFVQAAAADIYSGNGHDTLTFLAELASVRRMFLSTGKQLLRLQFPKTKKQLASNWLEGRYGWRPLYGDIKSIHAAISSYNDRRTRFASKKGNKQSWSEGSTWVTGAGTNNQLRFSKSDRINIGVRGCVTADIDVPKFQFNPVRTAWELVPYSFVLDWFVNVGTAISAASFMSLQSAYSASVGSYVEIERSFKCEFEQVTNTAWGTFIEVGTDKFTIERRIPCGVPLIPQTSLNLNPYKVIDLLGMIVQKRKGG